MSIKRRLAAAERRTAAGRRTTPERGRWVPQPLYVDVDPDGKISPGDEARIEAAHNDAIRAGWTPRRGPAVLIIEVCRPAGEGDE